MCTKMSSVPSPRVRKPNPLVRLNHLTSARSSPLSGVTTTCVRCSCISAGCTAVELSIGDDAERLQATVALLDETHYSRAFERGVETRRA